MYHSSRARGILVGLKIGELDARAKAANNLLLNPYAAGAARTGIAKGSGPYGLGAYDPKKPLSRLSGPANPPTRPAIDEVAWRRYDLLSVTKLNHDTSIFRFAVPHKARLNVGMGRHLSIGLTLKGKMTKREYTPIADEPGYFELMIKRYEGGPMSEHIHGLKVGDGAMMRGLYGRLDVKPDRWDTLFMIAAGTGIAPMMTFIRYFASVIKKELKEKTADGNDPKSQSKPLPKVARCIHLIYANKTEEDILLKNELDNLASIASGTFTIDYILSRTEAPQIASDGTIAAESAVKPKDNSETSPQSSSEDVSEPHRSEIETFAPPTATHFGRISSSIFTAVQEKSLDAWTSPEDSSSPLKPKDKSFALVCGPDSFTEAAKVLLKENWLFEDSNFHVF